MLLQKDVKTINELTIKASVRELIIVANNVLTTKKLPLLGFNEQT